MYITYTKKLTDFIFALFPGEEPIAFFFILG